MKIKDEENYSIKNN